MLAADAIFLITILIVLALDIYVFVKYKTYETATSFVVSTCLGLDILARLV